MRHLKVTKRIYQADQLFASTLDCPEQRLFVAVLSQAVHDATCGHVSKLEKEAAEAFLLSRSEHLKLFVNSQAGFPNTFTISLDATFKSKKCSEITAGT